MTVLGTCGVGSGVAGMNQTSLPSATTPSSAEASEDAMAFLEAAETDPRVEVLWESPHRRPLAAGNAVVSSMLLIGSFMLTFRRKHALWWIRNAVAANVLW